MDRILIILKKENGPRASSVVMYNLGTFLEGPRDQGPGPSRTKGYNLGTR